MSDANETFAAKLHINHAIAQAWENRQKHVLALEKARADAYAAADDDALVAVGTALQSIMPLLEKFLDAESQYMHLRFHVEKFGFPKREGDA